MECGDRGASRSLLALCMSVLKTNSVYTMAKSLVEHVQKLNIRWRMTIGAAIMFLMILLTPSGLEVKSDATYPSEFRSSSLLGRLKDKIVAPDWMPISVHPSSAVGTTLIPFERALRTTLTLCRTDGQDQKQMTRSTWPSASQSKTKPKT
jgi:hypothetical protein